MSETATPQIPFPAPWSVVEHPESFGVVDAKGQALAYIYFEDEPSRAFTMKRITRHQAQWIATNIATVPALLQRSRE